MKFTEYIVRRLLFQIFVIIGLTALVFAVANLIPGDPFVARYGTHQNPFSEEALKKLRQEWGLDKPKHEQYIAWLTNIFRGNLGRSVYSGRDVAADIVQHFPATFELATVAFLISIVVGLVAGVVSATRRNSVLDHSSRLVSLAGVSMPIFWLGIVALIIFYLVLGWAGPGRIGPYMEPPPYVTGLFLIDTLLIGDWKVFSSSLQHLVIPAVVMAFAPTALIARITRSSMLEVLLQDYIRTARAKGLAERIVIYKHALKNALIPVVTIIGLVYGFLLEGSILVETVFAWPGLGRYAFNVINILDYPGIQGVTLVYGLIFTSSNLITDMFYAAIDPRIRYG